MRHLSEVFNEPFETDNIYYVYYQYQPIFADMHRDYGVRFTQKIPDDLFKDSSKLKFLVLDDQILSLDKTIVDLFVRKARFNNICVFFLAQFVYDLGQKEIRVLVGQASMLIFMAQPSVRPVVRLTDNRSEMGKALVQAFDRVLKTQKYGYLVYIRDPAMDNRLRLRTNIFPNSQDVSTVFMPNK